MATSGSGVGVGFGRASLWGTWATDRPCADDIDVRSLVAVDAAGPAALLTADVCGMWPSTCTSLGDAVAAALGTAPERVGIFCTQNHGAPMEGPGVYDLDRWRTAFVAAAHQALAAAQPAMVATIESVPTPAAVFRRRVPVPGLGRFTFYYGFEAGDPGQARCDRLLDLALRGLACGQETVVRHLPGPDPTRWPTPDLPVPSLTAPVLLPPAPDPLLQGVFFRTPTGAPIGSLVRWSAHPVTANLAGGPHSGDYPAWLRRRLEERLGGGALFLTGPCGDQAPLVDHKRVQLADRLGTCLADQLCARLAAASWQPVSRLQARSRRVCLPLRSDYPTSIDAARTGREEARGALRQAQSLVTRKRLAEQIERLSYTVDGHHQGWCGFRPEHTGGQLEHALFALALGPVAVVGLPGEPFAAYSAQVRQRFPGRVLLVAEEANGYLSYVPGADDFADGGYGAAAAILAPQAEPLLVDAASRLVTEVWGA